MPTRLAGILNLTPDSFSDGGKYLSMRDITDAARCMLEAGAYMLDVGAESTRPGATPVSAEEEWSRLVPFFTEVLPALTDYSPIISVDTRHAQTAATALAQGARWINDVSGFADEAMIAAVREHDCTLVLMHSLSVPANPNVTLPEGADVTAELMRFAEERIAVLERAGVARERIVFDPGLGFGKTAVQSWQIIERLEELRALGVPLYIGHSRKSFLKDPQRDTPEARDGATLKLSARLMAMNVDYLRVHDVAAHASLLKASAS